MGVESGYECAVKSRRLGAATLAVLGCATLAVLWLLFAPRPEAPARGAATDERAATPATAEDPAAPDTPAVASSDEATAPSDEASAAPTSLPPYTGPAKDRARADRLREALTALLAGKHTTDDGTMPSPVGTGNQAKEALGRYVDAVMHEQFVPLAGSCYEALLERRPQAQGAVTLDFSIVGERSVGGVVLDVEVGLGPQLKGGDFETCLRESMYSVVFDAPPGEDGTVTVTQSFELSP